MHFKGAFSDVLEGATSRNHPSFRSRAYNPLSSARMMLSTYNLCSAFSLEFTSSYVIWLPLLKIFNAATACEELYCKIQQTFMSLNRSIFAITFQALALRLAFSELSMNAFPVISVLYTLKPELCADWLMAIFLSYTVATI